MGSLTLTYGEIKQMQMEHPDLSIWLAGEPVTLASACLECRGAGHFLARFGDGELDLDRDADCDNCHGTGYVVSETGRDLLKFVAKFGNAS